MRVDRVPSVWAFWVCRLPGPCHFVRRRCLFFDPSLGIAPRTIARLRKRHGHFPIRWAATGNVAFTGKQPALPIRDPGASHSIRVGANYMRINGRLFKVSFRYKPKFEKILSVI